MPSVEYRAGSRWTRGRYTYIYSIWERERTSRENAESGLLWIERDAKSPSPPASLHLFSRSFSCSSSSYLHYLCLIFHIPSITSTIYHHWYYYSCYYCCLFSTQCVWLYLFYTFKFEFIEYKCMQAEQQHTRIYPKRIYNLYNVQEVLKYT